jgi:threonine/homoserine/homoserine lactone efflux protein
MPRLETLLLFCAAGLALVLIPGPNHLFIVTRSIAQGRRAGLASAFGVETGTLVHISAAAAGLSALIASSALAFDVVKYLGAAYLIYLGVRALRADNTPRLEGPVSPRQTRRLYLDGVLVNVLNPKVALFFLAFLPQFIDPSRPTGPQVLVLGLVLAGMGLTSDVLYACCASALGGWLRRRPSFWRRQRYVAAGVYLALGAAAALAGHRRRP